MDAQRDLLIHMVKLNPGAAATCQSISDRIATEPDVDVLLSSGLLTFGDRDRFATWLLAPNQLFGGLTPLAMLASGSQETFKDELVRIEYGELIA